MNGWKALGFKTYEDYLRSNIWKEKAAIMIELKRECEVSGCHEKKGLVVHHKTYKNVGDEKQRDLQVLCKFHHEEIHKKRGRNARDN